MYNVNSIQFGNSIKIDYEISGEESTLRNVTSKDDMVHPDFTAATQPLFDMIIRFCEFDPALKKRIAPKKVTFSKSEKAGRCVKITFILRLENSINGLQITTPKYTEIVTDVNNQLTEQELNALELLKDEAFNYAHGNKTAQVSLFEDNKNENGTD